VGDHASVDFDPYFATTIDVLIAAGPHSCLLSTA
jgi:hypothetical protein